MQMRMDIISDTVCPWCFIGKKRMEAAMAELPELGFEIMWRPFQLNPDMPAEGMDRRTYMKQKFGSDHGGKSSPVYQAILDNGKACGIDFDFQKIEKMPNTLDSHRLVRWAYSTGNQDAVVENLFRAYFEEARDISDRAVLVDIATHSGMDAELVGTLLDRGADIELVQKEDETARSMGVSGVPCFLINGQFMLTGAQDTETFVHLLKRIKSKVEEKAAEA